MKMFSNDLLAEIREKFDYVDSDPVDGECIFLDSASGSLRLKAATDVLAEHSRWPDQVGRLGAGSGLVADAIQRGTEDVRLLLGARSGVKQYARSVSSCECGTLCPAGGGNSFTGSRQRPSHLI